MSRTGKLPVPIPDKVKVSVEQTTVTVEGPKGKMSNTFAPAVKITVGDEGVAVRPSDTSRFAGAMQGTTRSIISNMVKGVVDGFSKDLQINGVGFRASVNGNILDLSVGYSHPIRYEIPEGVLVTVAENTKLKVQGIDKQKVGAVAADIKRYYPPEPYKGKGIHIVGEHIVRKEGKTVS
jgi:large subunit ribosomal protein L6